MMQSEQESFEAELRRLRPAQPPEEVLAQWDNTPSRLGRAGNPETRCRAVFSGWTLLRGWFRPVWAASALALMLVGWKWWFSNEFNPPVPSLETTPLVADDVVIDRQLVAAFEGLAELPTGEPIRFTCYDWIDRVTVRDNAHGVVIERREPRRELVPATFTTY